jgi:hypothetical protein
MKARLRSAAGAGLLCVAALAGCGQKGENGNSTLSVGTPCFIEGVTSRAACHQISVPEDWSKPSGRQVKLNVAVLPSAGVNKDGSALFVLAGGPGQAATHYGDLINKELDRVLATRPIILMDQRGTGGSNGLRCAFGGASLAEVQAQSSGKELQECRSKWGEVALQHYTTRTWSATWMRFARRSAMRGSTCGAHPGEPEPLCSTCGNIRSTFEAPCSTE